MSRDRYDDDAKEQKHERRLKRHLLSLACVEREQTRTTHIHTHTCIELYSRVLSSVYWPGSFPPLYSAWSPHNDRWINRGWKRVWVFSSSSVHGWHSVARTCPTRDGALNREMIRIDTVVREGSQGICIAGILSSLSRSLLHLLPV